MSVINTLMNVRHFYVLAMTKSFNDLLGNFSLPDDGTVRPNTCSSLLTLNHSCDFNEACAFCLFTSWQRISFFFLQRYNIRWIFWRFADRASQYLTNLLHKICFAISFISCLYMFRAHVFIIRRSKLHYTASGIITPIGGRLVHETEINKVDVVEKYIVTI